MLSLPTSTAACCTWITSIGITLATSNKSNAGCSAPTTRSEEHTSELQSLMRISYAVFCLKKTKTKHITQEHILKPRQSRQHDLARKSRRQQTLTQIRTH